MDAFETIVTNHAEGRWEPAELNGGKLCEAVFSITHGYLSGTYPVRASKPTNILASCQALEREFPSGERSPRIQIPWMIIALYEIRNNRGVGHSGGDVNPNEMDATVVLYMSKWLVAELVRFLHAVSTEQASKIVEDLIVRNISLVWNDGEKRRVLRQNLTLQQQVLLLLVGVDQAEENELISWLEHKNPSNLRARVLKPMHRSRLIEYDSTKKTIELLPPGVALAESLIRNFQK